MNNAFLKAMQTSVRVRPSNPQFEDNFTDVLPSTNQIHFGNVIYPTGFDYTFASTANQDCVFSGCIKFQLDRFIRGENVSVIVFGPTYGGKSFTVFGPGLNCVESETQYGILPKVATYVFSKVHSGSFANVMLPRPKVTISILEVYEKGFMDLINPYNYGPFSVLQVEKGVNVAVGVAEESCETASDLINFLQIAMTNRKVIKVWANYHPTSVIVKLYLHHPVPQDDGTFKMLTSQAMFTEVASSHPNLTSQLPTTQNGHICFDLFILSALARYYGNAIQPHHFSIAQQYDLFNLLMNSFDRKFNTLLMCCISPSSATAEMSKRYLSLILDINHHRTIKTTFPEQLYYDSITEEYLRARQMGVPGGSVTTSEENGNWLQPQSQPQPQPQPRPRPSTECEEDSANAQSHPHLECIEEVTESEEELSEKISESQPSVDDSPCESDQEEEEVEKICSNLDNDFHEKLEDMCNRFNSYVDTFVDSFKTKSVLHQAKEGKKPCVATRRGGLPYLQKMNDTVAPPDMYFTPLVSNVSQQVINNYQNGIVDGMHGLANTKTAGEGKQKFVSSQDVSEKKNSPLSQNEESNLKVGTKRKSLISITKSNSSKGDSRIERHSQDKSRNTSSDWPPPKNITFSEREIDTWISKEEQRLRDLRAKLLKQSVSMTGPQPTEKLKNMREDKKKSLLEVIDSVSLFLDMANDIVDPVSSQSPDEGNRVLDHRIRKYRQAKEIFKLRKSSLEKKVKEKTATEQELRDHLISDEIIETFDLTIEYMNTCVGQKNPLLNISDTQVGKIVIEKLTRFSVAEIRYLLFCYFKKVIDLREAGKLLETDLTEQDMIMKYQQAKISELNTKLQQSRVENGRMLLPYSPRDTRDTRDARETRDALLHRTANNTITLQEGASSSSRHATVIPQQNLSKLQVKPTPPTKVTFTGRKLTIEQGRKKKH